MICVQRWHKKLASGWRRRWQLLRGDARTQVFNLAVLALNFQLRGVEEAGDIPHQHRTFLLQRVPLRGQARLSQFNALF